MFTTFLIIALEEISTENGGVSGESQVNVPPSQTKLGTIPEESAWMFDSVAKNQMKTFSSWGAFAPSSSLVLVHQYSSLRCQ